MSERVRNSDVTVTGELAAFIAASKTAPLPADIRLLAKLHILDTLASIVACRDLEPSELARKFALAHSGTCGAATILGTRQSASLIDAVFASAMTAHGAEINDFIPSAFVQPGPAIVSAAIALAETRGGSGEDVLRAVVTGYELAGRMPKALGIVNLKKANIANHGIGPVFGTAAAAASMLGFTEDRIPHLLTFCAQQAAGSYQWLLDVEHIEKSFVFAGIGSRAGLQAALFVEAGFRGVRDSLDHPSGWMRSSTFSGGDADRAYLVDKLGERFELEVTAYKRFPVGGPTQPAVQGLLELLPKIRRDAVRSILIEMPGRWQAFRDAEMPALNLRYLSSLIVLDGKLDFFMAQSRDRMLHDEAIRQFMSRVDVVHDPEQEHAPGTPRTESARVTVTHEDGEQVQIYVPYVVGFPSHPMPADEVRSKAFDLTHEALGAERAQRLIETVDNLESLENAAELVPLIAT